MTTSKAARSLEDYEGDHFIAFSTWRWIEAQSKTGKSPIYRYRFDQDHPKDPKRGPEEAGAYHSAEIEFVFGALDSETWISWRPEDHKLTDLMRKYWSNFAKNGDPNGSGLPQWPQVHRRHRLRSDAPRRRTQSAKRHASRPLRIPKQLLGEVARDHVTAERGFVEGFVGAGFSPPAP